MAQYVGPLSLGYSFAYPTTWSAAKKPIKTHLSEVIVSAPKGSSASVGLVVDGPLKIGSIEEFGTPDVVGAKVLALERKKDSTKDVRRRGAVDSRRASAPVSRTLSSTWWTRRGASSTTWPRRRSRRANCTS